MMWIPLCFQVLAVSIRSQPKDRKHAMIIKRSVLLLIVLTSISILACGGSFATNTPGAAEPRATSPQASPTSSFGTPAPTSTSSSPTPGKTATISMTTNSSDVRPGDNVTISISVDPSGRGISGVQVEMEYDPGVFKVERVETRTLLGDDPVEIGPLVDSERGTIDYIAARIGPTAAPTTPGVFAIVVFQALQTARPGETSVSLTDVKIPDENIEEIAEVSVGGPLTLNILP